VSRSWPCCRPLADQVRAWAQGLGIETFVGTSGRVFVDMKAAPLLRAWLHRLRGLGVHFHMRHRWQGWDGQGRWCFASPQGDVALSSRTVVLALGGRVGRIWGQTVHGRYPAAADTGAAAAPANCGFDVQSPAAPAQALAGRPTSCRRMPASRSSRWR
jgi:predicted flavoprotein YhiN